MSSLEDYMEAKGFLHWISLPGTASDTGLSSLLENLGFAEHR